MNISKKWPLLGSVFAFLAFLFSGVGTKYLPERNELFGFHEINKNSFEHAKTNQNAQDVNIEGDVPYLRKLPILDNNLFIEQHYSELIFGGVNFGLVKFAARTDKGDRPETLKVSSFALALPAFDMPYLEFEYKNRFYTLEIKSEIISPTNVRLTYKIKSISTPTMQLKAGSDYSGT